MKIKIWTVTKIYMFYHVFLSIATTSYIKVDTVEHLSSIRNTAALLMCRFREMGGGKWLTKISGIISLPPGGMMLDFRYTYTVGKYTH